MKHLKLMMIALLLSSSIFAQVNLTQGLKMYLPFTGNAADSSGNTNVVTVSGAVLAADRFGNANRAYHFDGVNDFMSIALGSGMKPQYPFSFSCWVKFNSFGNSVNCLFNNDYAIPGSSYYGAIFNCPTGLLLGNVGNGGAPGPGSRKTKQSNQTLPVGSWHHVAVVVNSATNMKLYLDCAEIAGTYTGNGSGLVYSTGQGIIGRGNGGFGENYINAELDEMRFYDRALTEQEIDALYAYPNPPTAVVTLGPDVQYLCPGGSLTLTPSPGGLSINQWSDGSTGPDLTVNCPGEYWVQVTDACGNVGYDTVDVQMAPSLQVNLGPDRIVCPGTPIIINGITPNATSYLWSTGSTQTQISVSATNSYWIQASNQCYTSTDTINVTFTSPVQSLDASQDTLMCYNDTLVLWADVDAGAQLVWSTGETTPQITIHNPGTYWVRAVDYCKSEIDSIQVDLAAGCDSTNSLPENFSGQAYKLKDYYVNDALVITNLPQHNSIIIYDVRGRLVYQTANYQNNWRPQTTNGIYYYQLYSNQQLVNNGRLLIIKP